MQKDDMQESRTKGVQLCADEFLTWIEILSNTTDTKEYLVRNLLRILNTVTETQVVRTLKRHKRASTRLITAALAASQLTDEQLSRLAFAALVVGGEMWSKLATCAYASQLASRTDEDWMGQ